MAKTLRTVGLVWCYAVAALIALSLAWIAYRQGFGQVQEIMSPFNVANYIVTIIALAPGLACLWGAEKLKERRRFN